MEGAIVATGSDERLARVIAVINGKGGVGKSSITANLSGEMAAAGLRVLAVDTDLSGNLGLDLGYITDAANDKGKGIVQAVWGMSDLTILREVRPNLDVIPGGKALALISKISSDSTVTDDLPGNSVGTAFAERLAEVAADYDVILIDCAPGNPELQDMALTASRYILIPTKTDPAGWDGLRGVGPQVKKARAINPLLTYLGVVIFGHSPSATRVLRATRARLDEVADTVPVLDTTIRHSAAAAHDCRLRGQLARELARDANTLAKERIAALRSRSEQRGSGADAGDDNVIQLPSSLSGSADDVAGDYEKLARDVLRRIAEAEEKLATSSAAAGGE